VFPCLKMSKMDEEKDGIYRETYLNLLRKRKNHFNLSEIILDCAENHYPLAHSFGNLNLQNNHNNSSHGINQRITGKKRKFTPIFVYDELSPSDMDLETYYLFLKFQSVLQALEFTYADYQFEVDDYFNRLREDFVIECVFPQPVTLPRPLGIHQPPSKLQIKIIKRKITCTTSIERENEIYVNNTQKIRHFAQLLPLLGILPDACHQKICFEIFESFFEIFEEY
jgi:hypothetical protein